jgi:hypothetical protein
MRVRSALVGGLVLFSHAGCSWPVDPNEPDPVPVSRVVYFRATPLPLVAGDTVLMKVGIADSLDARIKYLWANAQGAKILPVDGRLDGPAVRMVVPNLPVFEGSVVAYNPADESTAGVRHRFSYQIQPG